MLQQLTPGSMGFPVIGETVDFFKPHSFDEIPPFVRKRMSKLVFIGFNILPHISLSSLWFVLQARFVVPDEHPRLQGY